MKLKFNIKYNTQWGESVILNLVSTNNDGGEKTQKLQMTTIDGCFWTIETAVMDNRQHPLESISYSYHIEDNEGCILRTEWNLVKRVYSIDSGHDYVFHDMWREIPLQLHLYSNAYITTMGREHDETVSAQRIPTFRKTILFRVSAPQLKEDEAIAVIGNHPAIGSWSQARYTMMTYCGEYEWMLSVNVDGISLPLEYKYVIVNKKNNSFVAWEEGDNRTTEVDHITDGQVLVLYGEVLRVRETIWKVAGVVIPVFSLRSKYSYGVGDFGDLKRMVDWAVKTGMKVIQILPVNDTTSTHGWSDSYPYNSISIYALHPHYIDLEQLGKLKDKNLATSFNRQRQELNALSYSDYEAVERVKSSYIHTSYSERGESVVRSDGFKLFYENNKEWLKPYAAFCVLRDRYHTAHYADWGEYSVYSEKIIDDLCDSEHHALYYIYYVQYNLYMQLKSACEYARNHHIVIKGDLPIGVNRDSVETWMSPKFFNLDSQTGAPPDAFARNGQNWGFPTYNWTSFAEDGYTWWRKRFRYMEDFFDAFRIDHVLGFFRIWEIPSDALFGTLGHFSPSLPLTVEEIGYFGLQFRKDFFTRPFINDKILDKIFGIHAQYVKEQFLIKKAYNLYELKSDYATQIQVRNFFDGKNDENSIWIRDGLYRLIANVLFVADPYQEEMYHPRISAYTEPVFDMLSDEEKDAFMRLYNNYFYRRHDAYWGQNALRKLPKILGNTRMLVCAEDLGMLPSCVESVLDSLRILSLQIQTMPKESGVEFSHIGGYPYRSVATISTHDMSPMRLWWEENPEQTQRYYTTMMQKEGRAPVHLSAMLAEEIIARHLYSPSMVCLLSFQDLMAMDTEMRSKNVREERINVPSDNYNHWQYRMHVNIEELLNADLLNRKLKTMIGRSQR